jgi:spermidine/putrescine transport system substrate-binding protein
MTTSRVSAAFAALLLAGSLAACRSADTTQPATSASGFPTSAAGTLHLYNWTDYLDRGQLAEFTKETGIEVVLDVYDSNETMMAKLQNGGTGYDVIFPSDYAVTALREAGLLVPIDVQSFPNFPNIKPEFQSVPWDEQREYTAPYMYGTTGIACNPNKSNCAAITSWHDYFTTTDPSVSSIKDEGDVVSAALRAVGVPSTDLCTSDKSQYAAALNLLKGFHPMAIDSDSSTERMLNGDSGLMQTWNGEIRRMRTRIPDIIYIYPVEGVNRWSDNMAVPVGAQNIDAAKVFINWMMDPQHIAAQSNYTGYDNSIEGASAYMGADLTSDPAIIPPAGVSMNPTPDCPQQVRDLYSEVFTTWLAQ